MTTQTQEQPGTTLPATQEGGGEERLGLRALLSKSEIKRRFEEVLGKEAAVFSASIVNVVNGSKALKECSPVSILNAGFQAAALKLPITPGLGQAAIVPYKGVAQFQIMVRGYVQLAHRSAQYKKINLAEVREGQLIEHNTFTGEVKLDASKRKSEKVIGYYFFFELINGYRHEAYWSVERCLAHGKKFSKSFGNPKGLWATTPEVMCAKTVVKNELAKWGPLSSDMRVAMQIDQAAIREDGTPDYIDTTAEPALEDATVPEPQAAANPAEAKPAKLPAPAAVETPKKEPPAAQTGTPARKELVAVLFTKATKTTRIDPPGFKFFSEAVTVYTQDRAMAEYVGKAKEAKKRVFISWDKTLNDEIDAYRLLSVVEEGAATA